MVGDDGDDDHLPPHHVVIFLLMFVLKSMFVQLSNLQTKQYVSGER